MLAAGALVLGISAIIGATAGVLALGISAIIGATAGPALAADKLLGVSW